MEAADENRRLLFWLVLLALSLCTYVSFRPAVPECSDSLLPIQAF